MIQLRLQGLGGEGGSEVGRRLGRMTEQHPEQMVGGDPGILATLRQPPGFQQNSPGLCFKAVDGQTHAGKQPKGSVKKLT